MSVYYEIAPDRAIQVAEFPQTEVVKGILSHSVKRSGSSRHVDPEDIDKPYWIEGRFQLDPVANIPGRGAMRIPVGLAPGRLAGTSRVTSQQ